MHGRQLRICTCEGDQLASMLRVIVFRAREAVCMHGDDKRGRTDTTALPNLPLVAPTSRREWIPGDMTELLQ